jgi:uncharacterized protein (DUF983 family)
VGAAAGKGGAAARVVRLRCPICGVGPLFHGWFAMHERCGNCGFRFERESGYFLGSIYLNYAVMVALALALHFLLAEQLEWSLGPELAVLTPVVAAAALALFRWSRALWLAFDVAFDPPEPSEFSSPDRRD